MRYLGAAGTSSREVKSRRSGMTTVEENTKSHDLRPRLPTSKHMSNKPFGKYQDRLRNRARPSNDVGFCSLSQWPP